MTDMIVSFLGFLTGVVDTLIPNLSVDSGVLANIADGLEVIVQFVAQVNFLIPLPTIFMVLSIVFGFRLVKFLIFCTNWLIRRLADVIP